MTYINRYYAGWASPNNLQGYLYIDQLDYSGGATELKLSANSISINYAFEDWNNPIIGMQCEFDVVNDKVDFYELLPLLTAEEREYKIRVVVISPTAYTLFEGFLNCDTITQKMLHKQIIKFAASSYLLKLDDMFAPSIEVLQNITFIDMIDEILISTGANYNIRVNSKLHAEGDNLLTGQTLFNKNGFYTELFWEDEVTRSSSLTILKAILTSFDCYIYWWRGFWYIERYEDIWSESVDFVEYVTGHSYQPDDVGLESGTSDDSDAIAHVDQTITDLHDLVFTEQSQTLSIIPGLKTIKINLEDKRVFNLVLSSLKDAALTTDDVPAPDYRTFQIYHNLAMMIWLDKGLPKSNIANAIQRIQFTADSIIIPSYRGIYTCFKVTVDKEDTAINIKFKYFIEPAQILGWTKKWEDYTFDFYWFLRIAGRNDYIVQSGEDWTTKIGDSGGDIDDELLGVMQITNISGSSFDVNTKTVEVSITIPVGLVETFFGTVDTGPLTGDQTLIFGLGSERVHTPDGDDADGDQVYDCHIGDFNLTSTGGLQSNVIEANVSGVKFLNKKDISMILYDMESYNYKNGILRGSTLLERTERWGVLGGGANITHKGVCWSEINNPPTIADSKTDNGTGFDTFTSLITGLTPGAWCYVRAYTIDGNSDISYGNVLSFNSLFLMIGSYYQGGVIFYFLQDGDLGYDPLIRKGLIAALTDQGKPTFWATLAGGGKRNFVAGLKNGIGYGLANSLLMDEDLYTTGYAVAQCLDYETGIAPNIYNDWYLPSIDELYQLCLQRIAIGGFTLGPYWSSSFPPQGWGLEKYASAIDFLWPNRSYVWQKNNWINVRAIRSFTEG